LARGFLFDPPPLKLTILGLTRARVQGGVKKIFPTRARVQGGGQTNIPPTHWLIMITVVSENFLFFFVRNIGSQLRLN